MSRSSSKGNSNTALRRDALFVVLLTFLGLAIAALLGLCCIQFLNQQSYIYVPGSFERPESYTSVYSLKSSISPNIISFPPKWIPHYSSFIGETYKRPATDLAHYSGYQALRFITEIFPSVMALSTDSISWIWTATAFISFALLGLSQLCAMWKPISNALSNSTNSVFLTCLCGHFLSLPFVTEAGISGLHYMDLLLGGSWIVPVFWIALIFGVFLIRGRPYNGDDLVNDLRMSGSMSAFLALSWNVLLPIGLTTLAIINYKISSSNEFYYWRGKSYFSYWPRKIAGLTQIGLLLLVPIIAIVQIVRYLTKGPPDILDRIQLLYRPNDVTDGNRRSVGRNREVNNTGLHESGLNSTSIDLNAHQPQDDAPPKYTPPPSYTTATGARLAKMLRQSIRRSVRRILRGTERNRSILTVDTEMNQQPMPPEYTTVLTDPSGNTETNNQSINEATEDGPVQSNPIYTQQRSLSLGRKVTSHKQYFNNLSRRPYSTSRILETHPTVQRPFTAEDVVTVLRSSTRNRQGRCNQIPSSELHEVNVNSFRSIENLVMNAEPIGESPSVDERVSHNTEFEQNNTSVI